MDFYKTVTSVSELRPTWGSLVWIVFLFFVVFCLWKEGRGSLSLRIITLFMSLALISGVPLLDFELGGFQFEHPWAKLAVFLGVFALLNLTIGRTSLSSLAKTKGTFVNRLILALSFSGLTISIGLNLLPDEIKKELGQSVSLAFVGQPAEFLWVVASLIFILLVG